MVGNRNIWHLVLGPCDLGRPPPATLDRQHLAVHEQLTAPDTPRLTPVQSTFEARRQHRAFGADALGRSDVADVLAEELS